MLIYERVVLRPPKISRIVCEEIDYNITKLREVKSTVFFLL